MVVLAFEQLGAVGFGGVVQNALLQPMHIQHLHFDDDAGAVAELGLDIDIRIWSIISSTFGSSDLGALRRYKSLRYVPLIAAPKLIQAEWSQTIVVVWLAVESFPPQPA